MIYSTPVMIAVSLELICKHVNSEFRPFFLAIYLDPYHDEKFSFKAVLSRFVIEIHLHVTEFFLSQIENLSCWLLFLRSSVTGDLT